MSNVLALGVGFASGNLIDVAAMMPPYSQAHSYEVSFIAPRTGPLVAENPNLQGVQSGNATTYAGSFTIRIFAPPGGCKVAFHFTSRGSPSGHVAVQAGGAGTFSFVPGHPGRCASPLDDGDPSAATKLFLVDKPDASGRTPGRTIKLTLIPNDATYHSTGRGGSYVIVSSTVRASNDAGCPVGSYVFASLVDGAGRSPSKVRILGQGAAGNTPACSLEEISLASLDSHRVSVMAHPAQR